MILRIFSYRSKFKNFFYDFTVKTPYIHVRACTFRSVIFHRMFRFHANVMVFLVLSSRCKNNLLLMGSFRSKALKRYYCIVLLKHILEIKSYLYHALQCLQSTLILSFLNLLLIPEQGLDLDQSSSRRRAAGDFR